MTVVAPLLPRPYPDDAWGADWSVLPTRILDTAELVPTQQCVRLDRLAHLAAGGLPVRWMLACLTRQPVVECKVLHAQG